MARIMATGVPVKHPELGELSITLSGDEVDIKDASFMRKHDGKWEKAPDAEWLLRQDLKEGPSYPLCAEPFTMRCALFVLFEWYGEAQSCWIKEPEHVILEGEIEPMESEPGVVY